LFAPHGLEQNFIMEFVISKVFYYHELASHRYVFDWMLAMVRHDEATRVGQNKLKGIHVS